jgi:hypothetical protein
MQSLSEPKQSYFDLLTAHQNLLEIVRQHPDDTNAVILLAECERQRDVAFYAMRERRSKML